MSDERVLSGGCQCGAVRYTIHEPVRETFHCHCSMCRKVHGALFATISTVSKDKFTIDKGADNIAMFKSSASYSRKFCKTCGGHLLGEWAKEPNFVYFTTGTLDGGAHPGHPKGKERHIHVGSKAPWHEITDDLPQDEEY